MEYRNPTPAYLKARELNKGVKKYSVVEGAGSYKVVKKGSGVSENKTRAKATQELYGSFNLSNRNLIGGSAKAPPQLKETKKARRSEFIAKGKQDDEKKAKARAKLKKGKAITSRAKENLKKGK